MRHFCAPCLRKYLGLAALVLLVLPPVSRTAPPPLPEFIPADAAGALVVRNLRDLRTRGDAFAREAGWNNNRGRPSMFIDMAVNYVDGVGLTDKNRPLGLLVPSPNKVGKKPSAVFPAFVVMLPFSDKQKVARRLGMNKDQLKENTVLSVKRRNFGQFAYIKKDYLFLSENKKALVAVTHGKRFAETLKPTRRKQFADADILLYLGPRAWGDVWTQFLDDLEKKLKTSKENEQAARQILTSLRNVRYGAVTLRVDKGLRFSFHSAFADDDRKTVSTFLRLLGSGTGRSGLVGLPTGKVLVAEGARVDGARSSVIARILATFFLREIPITNQVIAATDRSNVLTVFTEVWKRLQGHRLAIYRTSDERKLGLASMVAILEPKDAVKFLGEIRHLARLGNPATLNLTQGKKEDLGEVHKLIRDLGADEFVVRRAASNRLRLIGEPALPLLKEALKSRDAEVVRRARELVRGIEQAVAQRRKDLLSGKHKYRLRPSFVYYPGAEKRLGYSIDILKAQIDQKDPAVLRQLQGLLGPSWNQIRLARHGQQVVVLLGSDVKLFESALRNLKEGKPGLAGSPTLLANHKLLDPTRKVEFHFSIQQTFFLLRKTKKGNPVVVKPGPELTSLALRIDPTYLKLDFWIPAAECRPIIKYNLP